MGCRFGRRDRGPWSAEQKARYSKAMKIRVLAALSDGLEMTAREVHGVIRGQNNALRWLNDLRVEGLVRDDIMRGRWVITDAGRECLCQQTGQTDAERT